MGGRRGSVRSRTMAAFNSRSMFTLAMLNFVMVLAPVGRHYVVVGSPAAVILTVGFIITPLVIIAALYGTAGQQAGRGQGQEGERQPPQGHIHLITSLLSPAAHSSNPKGAPMGSATTEILPP